TDRRDERHPRPDRLGGGGGGWIYSAGRVHGISGLQSSRDRMRYASDPSHRIHASARYRARGGWTRADYCRSRVLELFAALRRSRRESDAITAGLRTLPGDPAPFNLEGTAKLRSKRS